MSSNQGREFGWNDPIEKDGQDYVLLQPGDYPFKVLKVERVRHNGSDNLPPCNCAKLTIELNNGDAQVTHRLYLHSKTEGLLCAFFKAIGARKHGQRFVMNWNAASGATGMCKVVNKEYKGEKYNEIKKFHDPEEFDKSKEVEKTSGVPDVPSDW